MIVPRGICIVPLSWSDTPPQTPTNKVRGDQRHERDIHWVPLHHAEQGEGQEEITHVGRADDKRDQVGAHKQADNGQYLHRKLSGIGSLAAKGGREYHAGALRLNSDRVATVAHHLMQY